MSKREAKSNARAINKSEQKEFQKERANVTLGQKPKVSKRHVKKTSKKQR